MLSGLTALDIQVLRVVALRDIALFEVPEQWEEVYFSLLGEYMRFKMV